MFRLLKGGLQGWHLITTHPTQNLNNVHVICYVSNSKYSHISTMTFTIIGISVDICCLTSFLKTGSEN